MDTPVFLTREIAFTAMKLAAQTALATDKLSKSMFHIVMLVPVLMKGTVTPIIRPTILAEHSLGKKFWKNKYEEIAVSKAFQLWDGQNLGGTDSVPHLLFEGDTHYWGGVKRDGIVVACSGVQSHFDKMISSLTVDLAIGLAYEAKEIWVKNNPEKHFV